VLMEELCRPARGDVLVTAVIEYLQLDGHAARAELDPAIAVRLLQCEFIAFLVKASSHPILAAERQGRSNADPIRQLRGNARTITTVPATRDRDHDDRSNGTCDTA